MMANSESIVLGGGCFWCLEAAYQQIKGVSSVIPGYSGGDANSAHYQMVSTGMTDHIEVVKVIFDPDLVSLSTLLGIFWMIHDPTSLNQQGADIGSQYASAIFYTSDEQKTVVEASFKQAQSHVGDEIMTLMEPLREFFEAEEYHHNYYMNNPEAGYCQAVIDPKLTKLRSHFAPLLTS